MSVYVHVDLDAFFASVEQLDHIEYRGKPVIVGGVPGDRRAVVSTASYEARAFGVHSAMPLYKAIHLCPEGIFVRGNMKRYHQMSDRVMSIFADFSPDVQQMSVDEAFIDLTGTERLFGNPVETAKEIKRRVKEETGLTVSIGLASSKYLAKIASGLQKPDGLFVIPQGQEENFMLSLPLNKVWGAGSKTLEKLNKNGIHTTKDVHDRSLELLQSLFGKSCGAFLYGAVRGQEVETFSEAKNHSISAENTFLFDLTGEDVLNTALLELSYTVSFRMLKEQVRSSTVCIKIRYDDFTTITVQDTSQDAVSSMDDLFARVKKLFWKKYDPVRGIRLLGVGLQNVESASLPSQGNLFDFGEGKRHKVEEAILKAQQKDPGVKITKAALLKNSPDKSRREGQKGKSPAGILDGIITSLFALLSFLFVLATPAKGFSQAVSSAPAESVRESDGAGTLVFDTSLIPLLGEDEPYSLYNTQIGNTDVEFFTQGYWQSKVSNTSTYTFGFGSEPFFTLGNPVFTQNVDLILTFLLNKHWYFEASFADSFDRNTLAAGYRGEDTVREVRIANRGIIFPSIYSVDSINRGIGGSDNEAFGVSAHLEGEKWISHSALRYDMLESHEKSWYGKNAVTENQISLTQWYSGNQYVLPSADAIQGISEVYVENSSGTYRDSSGRRFKKLDSTQYLLISSSNLLVLSKDAGAKRSGSRLPAVALAFDGSLSVSDEGLGISDFLEDVADWFEMDVAELSKYAPENKRYDTIDGSTVLFIQHPLTFSPFVCAFRYDGGISSATDAAVVSKNTGISSKTYLAQISEDDIRFASTDFFYSNHTYVDVYRNESSSSSLTDPQIRFPFGKEQPLLYLNGQEASDLVVSLKSYSPVNRLDIGTKAVDGTVRVYKNGILDGGAQYDGESGTITLSSAVADSDHIFATWYEESEDSQTGAIAAAAGFMYTPFEPLSMDLALSSRWSLARDRDYASKDYSSPGFVTLATGIHWSQGTFSLSNTAAASIETENTTGTYRIAGMDDQSNATSYLTKSAAEELPEGFIPLLNKRDSDQDDFPTLVLANNGSTEAQSGIQDSDISGYAIPISWDFSSFSEESLSDSQPAWAACALTLNGASNLSNSSQFSIWLKNADLTITDFDVYLQLGVLADEDLDSEDRDLIPTWKISDASATDVKTAFDSTKEGGTVITVNLSDVDRSRFCENQDARLIITSTKAISGTIYAGPYQAEGSVCQKEADSAFSFSDYQSADASLSSSKIKKFNTSTNYVQKIQWTADTTSLFASTETYDDDLTRWDLKISRYFSEVDLSHYENLSLYFKIESEKEESISLESSDKAFTFELTRSVEESTALAFSVSRDLFTSYMDGNWHELMFNLDKKTLTIDGHEVSLYDSAIVDKDVVPTCLSLTLNTANDAASFISRGCLSFDELSLTDGITSIILQDTLQTSWEKKGNLFESSEMIKDLSLKTRGTALGNANDLGSENYLSSSAQGKATVATIRMEGSAAHAQGSEKALSSASHSIQTTRPVLKLLHLSDSFSYDWEGKSLSKDNSAKINFNSLGFPLSLSAKTQSDTDNRKQSQQARFQGDFTTSLISATLSALAEQNLSSSKYGINAVSYENYGESYKDASLLSLSTGDEKAGSRKITAKGESTLSLPVAKLKPKVFFDGQGVYKSSTTTSFTHTTSSGISLPFTIGKNNFSLGWNKTSSGVESTETGGDYFEDKKELQQAWQDESWYFKSFPIYDLISSSLSHAILNDSAASHSDTQSLSYSGLYTASWKRGRYGTSLDYILPAGISASFSREIRTASSISDLYQLKTSISYNAINVFGSKGFLSLTDRFNQDEYLASLQGTLKIPRSSKAHVTMLFTGYVQGHFIVNQNNNFKTALEGTFQDFNNWSAKQTFIWKRDGSYSVMLDLLELWNKTIQDHAKLKRSENVQLSASRYQSSGGKKIQKAGGEYSHNLDIALSDIFSLNTAVGVSANVTIDTLISISASFSLGGTIQF